MFNIGFDCNVVDATGHWKDKRFISGSMAYFLGILSTMIKKKGANLRITADGEEKQNGKLMLTSIANGQFCGGGIRSNPTADVHDGIIDLNIVYDVPRRRFVTLLPKYMKGTHVTQKGIGQFSLPCRKITVEPLDGTMRVCTDGETADSRGLSIEIVHNAFTLSLPPKKE
jgi:diacylglycerol kinase family enzyme